MAMIKKRRKPRAEAVASNGNGTATVAKLEKRVSWLEKTLDKVVEKLKGFYSFFTGLFGVMGVVSGITMITSTLILIEKTKPHGFFAFTSLVAIVAVIVLFILLACLMHSEKEDLDKITDKDKEDDE